jgi:WD and tetratricopeptide repeats protein 1
MIVHYVIRINIISQILLVFLQFLPFSGDNIIISAAADCRVRVHDVTSHETVHVFGCHTGRVKRLATAPGQPNVFWSASEDGTVM